MEHKRGPDRAATVSKRARVAQPIQRPWTSATHLLWIVKNRENRSHQTPEKRENRQNNAFTDHSQRIRNFGSSWRIYPV